MWTSFSGFQTIYSFCGLRFTGTMNAWWLKRLIAFLAKLASLGRSSSKWVWITPQNCIDSFSYTLSFYFQIKPTRDFPESSRVIDSYIVSDLESEVTSCPIVQGILGKCVPFPLVTTKIDLSKRENYDGKWIVMKMNHSDFWLKWRDGVVRF